MNGTLRILIYLLLASILAVWLRIGWVFFYPYEPLTFYDIVRVINPNKQVKAGADLWYLVNAKKNVEGRTTVFRYLVNGEYVPLSMYESAAPEGVIFKANNVYIPKETKPGTYRLYQVCDYKISDFPTRFVSVLSYSEPFEVLPADEPERGERGERGKQGIQGETGKTGGIRFFSKGDNK